MLRNADERIERAVSRLLAATEILAEGTRVGVPEQLYKTPGIGPERTVYRMEALAAFTEGLILDKVGPTVYGALLKARYTEIHVLRETDDDSLTAIGLTKKEIAALRKLISPSRPDKTEKAVLEPFDLSPEDLVSDDDGEAL